MIVIYTADGGTVDQYDAEDLLCSETGVLENTLELHWADIKEGLRRQRPEVMRSVVWAHRRRDLPNLRLIDFDPRPRQLKARFDADEVQLWAEEIERNAEADEETRAAAYRDLEGLALDREQAAKTIAAIRGKDGPPPTESTSASPDDA